VSSQARLILLKLMMLTESICSSFLLSAAAPAQHVCSSGCSAVGGPVASATLQANHLCRLLPAGGTTGSVQPVHPPTHPGGLTLY